MCVMLGSGEGELGAGTHSQLGSAGAGPVRENGSVGHRFVLCFLLICIIVVTVPFVCCSVKLPLSRSTVFCLFLSILLLRTPAGGGASAWHFYCQPQPNQNKESQHMAQNISRIEPVDRKADQELSATVTGTSHLRKSYENE